MIIMLPQQPENRCPVGTSAAHSGTGRGIFCQPNGQAAAVDACFLKEQPRRLDAEIGIVAGNFAGAALHAPGLIGTEFQLQRIPQ